MKRIRCMTGRALITAGGVALISLLLFQDCSLFKKQLTPLEKDSGVEYIQALSYAGGQVDKAMASLSGGYPVYSENGRWVDSDQAGWARGYYPGMLWLLYQSTLDKHYSDLADSWIEGLASHSKDNSSDGLGQVFYPTFVIGYQVTGNRRYREVALEAAETLSSRFNTAGFFPAFGEPGDSVLGRRLSIETLMDLELLYWAAEASGNKNYSRQADVHALFTIRRLINDDGKVLNMADFDPRTGETHGERTDVLAENHLYTPKGYSPSSVWAQGQSWAVYGFITAYRHTSHTLFLDGARKAADYIIKNLPEDSISLWDYELPEGTPKLKDTTAAAVAAAGLLKLSGLSPNEPDRLRYRQAAIRILTSLNRTYFGKADGVGVIGSGLFDNNAGLGVGGATAWGDYFYLEALLMLKDRKA